MHLSALYNDALFCTLFTVLPVLIQGQCVPVCNAGTQRGVNVEPSLSISRRTAYSKEPPCCD